jgi:cytochrome d ubiquinol oxidase subunit II
MLDYEILRIIWWLFLGVLLIGFAVTDGFDFGASALLTLVARTDPERRIVINTMGPVWEGNQVWFILGGGAIFAAWPYLYAVAFSGFYTAMFLLLVTLILRPVSFKYRSKLSHTAWRNTWDWILSLCAILSAISFGLVIGNVLQGVPFHFDNNLRAFYTGSFWQLFNPFALLCGFISFAMLIMHGGLYLSIKTENPIKERAIVSAQLAAGALTLAFAVAGIWITYGIDGYVITNGINTTGISNPLYKSVSPQIGAWLNNYQTYPWALVAPILGFTGAMMAIIWARWGEGRLAFLASGCSIFGTIATFGISMFPFLLPSSTHPDASLLVWDASSSQLTLFIMFIATIIFLPIIILYTRWVYKVLRGKVTANSIDGNSQAY